VRKSLESRTVTDNERIAQLEKSIKDFQLISEESERRFDETNKKVEVMESDLERAYERADSGEAYEKIYMIFVIIFVIIF